MEIKNISEFKVGDKIDAFFLIRTSDCKTTINGKKYLDFTLADKTGDINGKLWDYEVGDENLYTVNNLIKVRGTVTEWQGSLQFKIDKIRLSKEEDGLNIEDYVPVAPYSSDDMIEILKKYTMKIENKDIKDIVSLVIKNNIDKLMYYPAAKKNHHSIRGGLLYHTSTMLKAGEKLSEIYDFLDTDLLYAGIILHDIAKIEEMDSSELGIVSEYTVEGQLLGHIIIGVNMVESAAKSVGADKEVSILLQHMILSHHYEPEYGSPVKPMIPEAEILHYLDIMDARMYDMKKALLETKEGEFSERIWSLDNKKVYKKNL